MDPLFRGIDVSSYQGRVDWRAVRDSGVEFAILRCGYGDDDPSQDDKTFETNVAGCEAAGLPWGAYVYSYADTPAHAESEARHALRLLSGKKPLYPVYYDLEDARTVGALSPAGILSLAKIFAQRIREGGFYPGFYANKYWWTTRLTDPWYNGYPRWVAQYADRVTYDGSYGMWQYSNHGAVPGIRGRVLLDRAYEDYPAILRRFYGGAAGDAPSAPAEKTCVVQPGDTLSAIARRFGTTWQALAAYNRLPDPDLIHPGQVIRIPG